MASPTAAQGRAAAALEPLGPAGEERLRLRVRRFAGSYPSRLRQGLAQAFCRQVMAQLWDQKLGRLAGALRGPPETARQPLRREALDLVAELAAVAANLSIDGSAYFVGRIYATLLPDDLRSARGVFYTPPLVVTRLLDLLDGAGIDWSRCRVLEPACGGGAFLGPLARRMAHAIRDETLRQGLVPCGAVAVDKSIPTTSSRGRYSLAPDFAGLFHPRLSGKDLEGAIAAWQSAHLSRAALARMAIVQFGASRDGAGVDVTFPSGETQRLASGESSRIAKMVIEEFAPRFLEKPAVLLLSESGNKMVARHEVLLKLLKLDINVSKALPDILLADLSQEAELLLVFVEVVSTDGPITDLRRKELLEIAARAGYSEQHIVFLTAFMDRDSASVKKAFPVLSWNSFAWFASEPNGLVPLLEQGSLSKPTDLIRYLRPWPIPTASPPPSSPWPAAPPWPAPPPRRR